MRTTLGMLIALATAIFAPVNFGCGGVDGDTVTLLDATDQGTLPRRLRVTSIDPIRGPMDGGAMVAMTGTGFESDMTIMFGGRPVSILLVGGDELAVMRTPPSDVSGLVDVGVTLADGRAVVVPNAYTYEPLAAPIDELRVLSVTPADGPTTGGNLIVIEGRGFIEGAIVRLGNEPALEVNVLGPDALTAIAPPRIIEGVVDVHVETPATANRPALSSSLVAGYTYVAVAKDELRIFQVIPSLGPTSGNTFVTITGSGFVGAVDLTFGQQRATDVQVLSANAIVARTPPGGVGPADVSVRLPTIDGVPGRMVTRPGAFTYIDDTTSLAVSSVLPDSGPLAGNNRVVISGDGFCADAQVYFQGVRGSEAQVLAPTVISVIVPPGTIAGPANIEVRCGPTSKTLVGGYTYLDDSVPVRVFGVFPAAGPLAGGNVVTISGQGFGVGATVTIGGVPATEPTYLGTTGIIVTAPPGASAGRATVVVSHDGHSGSLTDGYTYLAPAVDELVVLDVIPGDGPTTGGTPATVVGSGFAEGTRVWFGGVAATGVAVLAPEALTVTVPAHAAGAVDVRVELADGTRATLPNAFVYTSDEVPLEPLALVAVTPTTGPTTGGTLLVLEGRGFIAGASVTVGGVAATEVRVLSTEALTALAPAGEAGVVDIVVKTPATSTRPAATATLDDAFTYTRPAVDPLQITNLIPAQGPASGGTLVTIAGTGFAAGAEVLFGQARATEVQVLGDTAISAKAPAGAIGPIGVSVRLPGGGAANTTTKPNAFTYLDDRVTVRVTSVIPDAGLIEGGNHVVVGGEGFCAAPQVSFNGVPATVVDVLGDSAVSVTVPAASSAGAVGVEVRCPIGAHTLAAAYTYRDDSEPLRLFGVFPAAGPLAGGNTLTLSGQGLGPGTTVSIGGVAATDPVYLGTTGIIVTAPPAVNAGAVPVHVQRGGEQQTLNSGYTYVAPAVDDLLVLDVIPGDGPVAGGYSVTLVGSGFAAGAEVWFGALQATNVQVIAPEALTLTVPAGVGAAAVNVRVQLRDGDHDTLFSGFEYTGGPEDLMVFRTIPNSGVITGGNSVAIEGRGFVEGMKVYFGGAPASDVAFLSQHALTVVAPSAAAAGFVTVRAQYPGDLDAPAFDLTNGYRYLPVDLAQLRLATVYPIQGKVAGGDLVLITGTGFDPAMQVRFGGTASPLVQVLSASSATALVPAHVAGLVDVELVNPDTTTSALPSGFRYVEDLIVDTTQDPALGGVLPARGPTGGGTLVRVIGANFAPGAAVTFGGAAASAVQVHSTSLITAIVPPGSAGAAAVVVSNPNGRTSQLATGWTYVAATTPPLVSNLWPAMGPSTGGTWTLVTGTGFATNTLVWFGLTPAVQTHYLSPTELLAEAPPHAVGSVDLTVVRGDGEVARIASGFAYYSANSLPAPPPVVGDVFPRVGAIDGGTEVNVVGSNFAPDARIYFGTRQATVTSVTDGSLRVVTTPPGPAGSARVTVVNPDGLTSSRADAFVYFAPPPLIRNVQPNVGSTLGGTVVTVRGKNFRGDSEVGFGGRTITTFITATSTELTFYAPPSDPTTIDVTVRNPDGQNDTAPAAFSYIDLSQAGAPTVTAIDPTHGPATGGYIALVHGANFAEAARVYFGLVESAEVEYLSDTVLKVVVPPGIVDSTVDLIVANGPLEGALPQAFTYDPSVVAPLYLRTVTPGVGSTTGGTVLTLEGSGFSADSIVVVGSTAAAQTTYISPTNLTVVTPPGLPGLVNVSVSRPDLSQATAFNAFAYQRPETLGHGPRITAVSPAIGPMTGGSLVLIEGAQFAGPASVYFGGYAATQVVVLDSTRVVARTPATTVAGTVAVSLINADGLIGVAPGGYAYFDAAGVTPPEVFIADPNEGSTFGTEPVRVLGDAFQPGARVYVCGRPALVTGLENNAVLNILTPANPPGPCKLTVVNPDGLTADRDNRFTYKAPAPLVDRVTPSAGPKEGGIDVVIQGDNFVAGATVRFGNAVSPQAIVVDAKTLTAHLPANVVGVVDVTVINPGASQATGTLPNGFTYLDEVSGSSPIITSVAPPRGPLTGGTPVRVLGEHFDPGALLIFNGTTLQNAVVTSPTELRFTTPAGTAGAVPITILNPNGLGVTLAAGFTYEPASAPAPTISTITPLSGPEGGNTLLTISGTRFSAGGTWSLGGLPLTNVTTVNANLVTVSSPPHAPGLVDLLYVGPDGQVALKLQAYEYVAAPKLNGVSPSLGGVAGGDTLTLVGDHFKAGMRVFFGTTQGTVIQVQSSSTAIVQTPPSLTRGFVDVTVRNADNQSGVLVKGFEYLDRPDIQSIWPPQGPNTGGTLVQIKGTGMHPSSRVFFGEVEVAPANVHYSGYDLLLAFSPPPTTSNVVTVRVLNPDDEEDSLAAAFTYKAIADLGPQPAITGFFPRHGPSTGGTRVAIDGLNFHPNGQAIFLPTPGTTVFVRSNRAVVVSPTHALGPASLYWVNPDGRTIQASDDFVYLDPSVVGPPPSIRELTPLRGPTAGNTTVTLLGLNFQTGARVRFGHDDASTDSITTTAATVRTPSAAAGPVEVWLVNPDGTQTLAADAFLYLPPPDILAVNPKRGPSNGGTLVTVDGRDFRADPDGLLPQILLCTTYTPATGVATGCAEATQDITAPSNGLSLSFRTPAHEPSATTLVVTAPDGQRDYLLDAFTYTAVPVVDDITPSSGPTAGGQFVTIHGLAFQPGAYVLFDGKPATEVSVVSAGQITCRTPANAAGPADVTIGNADGGLVVLRDLYTYLAAPTVSALLPSAGPEDGGIFTTISGLNFVGAQGSPTNKPRVFFGVTEVPAADVSYQSTVALYVKVPPGQGTVDVVVRNPDGQEGLVIDGFTYIPPLAAPVVTYILPDNGSTLGGDTLRVYGANFLQGARVFLGKPDADDDGTTNELGEDWFEAFGPSGSNQACEVRNNQTLLVCRTPAHAAGRVDVRVQNSDGQESALVDAFTYVPPPEDAPISVINIEPRRATIPGGGYITISGTGFREGVSVRFFRDNAGVAVAPFAESPEVLRLGPTLVRAKIPPSPTGLAGKIVIRVRNPGVGDVYYDAINWFEYTAGPVFVRHPGDRLPTIEGKIDRGSLIFDANGDGLQDVLVFGDDGQDRLLINGWEGRVGSFSDAGARLPTINDAHTDKAVAIDLDADGDLDLVKTSGGYYGDLVRCINTDGAGTFTCSQMVNNWGDCGIQDFAIGDVSCDGLPDVVVVRNNCRPLLYLAYRAPGGAVWWQEQSAALPNISEPNRAVEIGDLDGDGDNDLFVANDSGVQNRLYLNNCAQLGAAECAYNDIGVAGVEKQFDGHNYLFSNANATWSDARAICQSWGYDLTTLDSQAEADFLRLDAAFARVPFWTGLYDAQGDGLDNDWVTPNPFEVYASDWCANEPSALTEACVEYTWSTGSGGAASCWRDIACTTSQRFVCESTKPLCSGTWTFVDALYGPGKTFPVSGGNSRDAILMDIDHDGDLDIIIGQNGTPVQIHINVGGKFSNDDGYRWPQLGTTNLTRFDPVDLDDDGDLDIIALYGTSEFHLYFNDRFNLPGEPDGAGAFSDLTATRWVSDIRTDYTGRIGIGDLDDDNLPDFYLAGRLWADRMVMNNGYREGDPWRDDQNPDGTYVHRVGVARFSYNTFRALPERYDNTWVAALGDFNGDGHIDIAQCGTDERLSMWFNDGAAKWYDVTAQTLPELRWRCGYGSLSAADIDDDDDLDIVVQGSGDYWYNCTNCRGASMLVNNGFGTFTNVSSTNFAMTPSEYASKVFFTDFDNDGDLDWLTSHYVSIGARLFLNGGDPFNVGGAFAFERTNPWLSGITSDYVMDYARIDLDGDPYPDLYVGRGNASAQNRVWRNDGTGRFIDVTAAWSPAIADNTQQVIAWDFDNDPNRYLDIYAVNWGQDRYHYRQASVFADITNTALPSDTVGAYSGDAGDLDLDGYVDVVTGTDAGNQNRVLLNRGGTLFQYHYQNGLLPDDRTNARDIFLYDFDGDCDLDILMINYPDQDRIYLNTYNPSPQECCEYMAAHADRGWVNGPPRYKLGAHDRIYPQDMCPSP